MRPGASPGNKRAYEERGGLFGCGTTEVQSAKEIPQRLRAYLDSRILANRFAAHFADDPALRSFTPGGPPPVYELPSR